MGKGRILFLVLAFFVAMGWKEKALASTDSNASTLLRESTCRSTVLSTPLCEELPTEAHFSFLKYGLKIAKEAREVAQVESSVIISSPKVKTPQTYQAQPETIVDLDSNKIFNLVNQYRQSQGLQPFELENSVCELAQIRSTELSGELASGTIHAGLYNRNLPYWIWENAKVGSGEEETVAWWIGSPIHRDSIVGDYKYSCIKCAGSNCSQLFTSFSPK